MLEKKGCIVSCLVVVRFRCLERGKSKKNSCIYSFVLLGIVCELWRSYFCLGGFFVGR